MTDPGIDSDPQSQIVYCSDVVEWLEWHLSTFLQRLNLVALNRDAPV